MRRKVSNLNQSYGFVYQHKNRKLYIKWKALLPNSFCWKPAAGPPLKKTLNSSGPSASAKSHWLKNKAEKHFNRLHEHEESFSLSKTFPILQKTKCFEEPGEASSSCVRSFSICNVLWLPVRLESPLSPTPNSIESKEAIKIPSCRKKPLRRVDARRQLADMKRSRCSALLQCHCGGSHNNHPAGQERLLLLLLFFWCLQWGSSHLTGIIEEPGQGVLNSDSSGFKSCCFLNLTKQLGYKGFQWLYNLT